MRDCVSSDACKALTEFGVFDELGSGLEDHTTSGALVTPEVGIAVRISMVRSSV